MVRFVDGRIWEKTELVECEEQINEWPIYEYQASQTRLGKKFEGKSES